MKKLTKLLFSTICFSMLSLSACGGNTPPAHEHTWSGGWSQDATNHWHTCSGCDEKGELAAHVYDDDHDATCNVCGYTRSLGDHTPKSAWSFDGKLKHHHWHDCNHEGCELKFDYGEHDCHPGGSCKVCDKNVAVFYDIDSTTQRVDIAFGELGAGTYYFWVSDLSPSIDYYLVFNWDAEIDCYYYASSSASDLSSKHYKGDYVHGSAFKLPNTCMNHTDLFFKFTVEIGRTYNTGIYVYALDYGS